MFFNLSSCLSDWTELTATRGRYIIGLLSTGTLASTASTALTNLGNRAVGQHTHSITDPGRTHIVDMAGYNANTAGGRR